MSSTFTEGVQVSVETFYQENYSNPLSSEYMFAYRVTIRNFNSFPIKIKSRKWRIFDSISGWKEVEGTGVVGVQPVIQPNEEYQYVSGCNLKSEMGSMFGDYVVEDLSHNQEFKARIPLFDIIVPFKYN